MSRGRCEKFKLGARQYRRVCCVCVCFRTELTRARSMPRAAEESNMDMQLIEAQVRNEWDLRGFTICCEELYRPSSMGERRPCQGSALRWAPPGPGAQQISSVISIISSERNDVTRCQILSLYRSHISVGRSAPDLVGELIQRSPKHLVGFRGKRREGNGKGGDKGRDEKGKRNKRRS